MASKESYQRHKEGVKVRVHEYYQANREKIKAYSRDYYHRTKHLNPELKKRRRRESYLRNREQKLKYNKELWVKLRNGVLVAAGGVKCVSCGFDDWRALQVDHINGGGRQEGRDNPTYKNPRVYAIVIRDNPERYQVLCANCNWIKRYEKKEHRQKEQVT